jgi:hypothetical protein
MNINAISDKGGNRIILCGMDESHNIITPPVHGENALDAGYILQSSFEQKASKEQFKSEDGIVRAVDFTYETRTTAILMQRDKTLIDFLSQSVKGKLYLQYHYRGIANAKHQEIFSVVRITPQAKIDTPGAAKSFPYEAAHIAMNVQLTVSAEVISAIESALDVDIKTTGPVIIPAGAEFVIIETVV